MTKTLRGRIENNISRDVAVLPNDGGVFVGGVITNKGDETNQEGRVTAFDVDGVEKWVRTPARTGMMEAAAADSEGNVWVGGYFGRTEKPSKPIFGILQKLDGSNGSKLWPTDDPAYNPIDMRVDAVVVDSLDSVICVLRFADKQSKLQKRNKAGEIIWELDFPITDGGAFVEKYAISIDGGDRVAVLNPLPSDGRGAWVGTYNSSGNLTRSFRFNDSGYAYRAICHPKRTQWYVGGRKPGTDATSDAFVRSVDKSGNTIWERILPGTSGAGGEGVLSLAADSSGNIVLAGELRGQAMTAKLDSTGRISWQGYNDDAGGERAKAVAVAVDSNDNVISVGTDTKQDQGSIGWGEKRDPTTGDRPTRFDTQLEEIS